MAACILERDILRLNSKVLLLHALCVKYQKDGFHYASYLLQWIGSLYKDTPRDIFVVLPQDDSKIVKSQYPDDTQHTHVFDVMQRGTVKYFFIHMGFWTLDADFVFNVERKSICPDNTQLLKADTSTLLSIQLKNNNGSISKEYLDPSIVTRIVLGRKEDNTSEFHQRTKEQGSDYAEFHRKAIQVSMKKQTRKWAQLHMLTSDELKEKMQWFCYNPHFHWKMYTEAEVNKLSKSALRELGFHKEVLLPLGWGTVNQLRNWKCGHQML